MVALLGLTASLTAALAGTLSGVVVDEATGDPLPSVTLYAYDLRLSVVSTETNADGVFAFSELTGGPYRLLAYPHYTDNHATRIYPGGVDYCEGALLYPGGDDITFALPAAATLTGTLLTVDGDPAAGATVTAFVEGHFPRATLSDDDGHFEVVGLDAADWKCTVELDGLPEQHLGEVYDTEDALQFPVPDQGGADAGTHTLLPGITVEGGVYGPDDPVEAGTSVVVYANGQITTVQTDEDGLYSATGLPTGPVLPWSEPSGLALTYYPDADRPSGFLDAPDEGMVLSDADLFAPYETTLTVTVIDEDGAPVEGPGLMLYNSDKNVGKGATTDEDGTAQIVGLHGGSYQLVVFAADEGYTDDFYRDDDGAEAWIDLSEAEDAVLTVPLTPAVTLSGTITGDDGAPIYGAMILALSDDEAESTTTAADGTWILDGLPAGDWEVMVSYAGYCEADPGWVTVYHPGTVSGGAVEPIPADAGDAISDIDLTMPCDNDHDGMGDVWERTWGLDPTRDDGLEDLDGDGYNNLYEYRAGTNPAAKGRGGCGSRRAGLLLLAPMLLWRRRR